MLAGLGQDQQAIIQFLALSVWRVEAVYRKTLNSRRTNTPLEYCIVEPAWPYEGIPDVPDLPKKPKQPPPTTTTTPPLPLPVFIAPPKDWIPLQTDTPEEDHPVQEVFVCFFFELFFLTVYIDPRTTKCPHRPG